MYISWNRLLFKNPCPYFAQLLNYIRKSLSTVGFVGILQPFSDAVSVFSLVSTYYLSPNLGQQVLQLI
jgi:hypothetical protein